LADEVVAIELPDLRGTETARHRRHMINARFGVMVQRRSVAAAAPNRDAISRSEKAVRLT
jgi:hypothetical protein